MNQLDMRIVVVLLNWNGPIPAATEHFLWLVSTHPQVVAHMTIQVSAQHRAKNTAFSQIVEQVRAQHEARSSSHFTHILLVAQDVACSLDALDELILANREFISAIVPSRQQTAGGPLYPQFLPRPLPAETSPGGVERSVEALYEVVMSQEEPVEVLAMGADLMLIKIEALERTMKPFGRVGEWFWMSESSSLWAVGDCYDLLRTPPTPGLSLLQQREYTTQLQVLEHVLWEEDLCFAKNIRRFGYKLWVHPLARATVTRTMQLSYPPRAPSLHAVRQEMVQSHTHTVENRFVASVDGRQLAMNSPHRSAGIVVATAVWASHTTATVGALYNIGPHPSIIGRVSTTHTEITKARNDLVAQVEAEFGALYTHILFVDGDMTFSAADVDELLRVEAGIAFGLAVKRWSAQYPPAYLPLSGDPTDHGPLLRSLSQQPAPPIPVKGAGMAFTLVTRQVLHSVKSSASQEGRDSRWFWTEHVIDPDSHREQHLSEDYSFCRRAREAGHSVLLVPSVQLGHMDERASTIRDWLRVSGIQFDDR